MGKYMKVLAAIMLISMVVFTIGCKNAQNNKVGETNVNNNVVDVQNNVPDARDNVVDVREYVDLGLPSGTLWATCNVGANAPEEYGDYFAWGETEPKTTFSWNTYKYCNGDYNQLTKYCDDSYCGYNSFTDDLTQLQPNDDAASANWGVEWCMPTREQWEELIQNVTSEWTTLNGVIGRLFTANNGKTLFLPAAGYRWGDELSGVDKGGYYWSSSLSADGSCYAWSIYAWLYYCRMGNMDTRQIGQSVRAVRSAGQN